MQQREWRRVTCTGRVTAKRSEVSVDPAAFADVQRSAQPFFPPATADPAVIDHPVVSAQQAVSPLAALTADAPARFDTALGAAAGCGRAGVRLR